MTRRVLNCSSACRWPKLRDNGCKAVRSAAIAKDNVVSCVDCLARKGLCYVPGTDDAYTNGFLSKMQWIASFENANFITIYYPVRTFW